jgi:hypothetical protein
VNGTVTGGVSYRDYLFRNAGERFEDVTPPNIRALAADHGVAWADIDGDGDEDLALTGAGPDSLPLLWRNQLAPADAARAVVIRVLDARGRATRAGAEVRVYATGAAGRLLGTRLVDSGSGYDAQNDLPVRVAVPGSTRVDVEVVFPAAGRRLTARVRSVDPRARRTVVVRP